MIKFDPHEGNSIPASLQMFARNADWHQRVPDNNHEEDDKAGVSDEEVAIPDMRHFLYAIAFSRPVKSMPKNA